MVGRIPLYHTRLVRETVLFLFPAAEALARRPLLLLLAGVIAGILARRAGLSAWGGVGLLVALTAGGGLIPSPQRHALLIPMGALAGALLYAPWASLSASPPWCPPAAPLTVTGRIERVETQGRDLRCLLRDLRPAEALALSPPLSALRLIIKGGDALPVAEGLELAATCRLRPFTNFNNPGCFDYRGHMAQQGVAAWGVVKAADIALLPAPPGHRWKTALHESRGRIEAALFAHAPTPRSGALLTALLTGNRARIPKPVRDLFTRTGTAHLLAISGLHLGIVATLFFVLFRNLFSLWERPLLKGHTQTLTAAATLGPVVLYALLSGMAPSTLRALIAAALFLGALALREEADLPTTLALAALLILTVHPPALFTASFQLSFTAVAAILGSFSQLPQKSDPHAPRPMVHRVLAFAIPPCFASIGTAPLVWYHFGYAAPIGLLANLVVVPMASVAVILPGLIGVMTLPLCAPLAGLLFRVAGHAAEAAIYVDTLCAAIPGGYLTLPRPDPAVPLLILCLLFSLILSRTNRRRGPAAVAILCLILLGGRAVTAHRERHHNPSLRVTVLDVGHGTAVVISFPNGKRWLVDGGFAMPDGYDVGSLAVAPALQAEQITSLDAVVLTHPESDHLGGLIHILNHFAVKTLITGPGKGHGVLWDRFAEAASRSGARMVQFTDQTPPLLVEGVRVTCLHPSASVVTTGKGAVNNSSLVLQLEYGTHRLLLTGDIMGKAEARLVTAAGEALRSDVLVIPHHGSASSSTPAFLAQVLPSVAIVSAGQANRYGLPHAEALERYSQTGCALYRTDRHGAVTVESDGVSLVVSTALPRLHPLSGATPATQP